MFSDGDLEWEFEDENHRERLECSNGNRNINIIEGYADIKLKNKTINKDKEYNILITSEISVYDLLEISVVDSESENIIYYHNGKQSKIKDDYIEIKKFENPLISGDCFKINDTFYGKINDKKVFQLSMHKNQEQLFKSFYSTVERKNLSLSIDRGIQLEVNVKGKILTKY